MTLFRGNKLTTFLILILTSVTSIFASNDCEVMYKIKGSEMDEPAKKYTCYEFQQKIMHDPYIGTDYAGIKAYLRDSGVEAQLSFNFNGVPQVVKYSERIDELIVDSKSTIERTSCDILGEAPNNLSPECADDSNRKTLSENDRYACFKSAKKLDHGGQCSGQIWNSLGQAFRNKVEGDFLSSAKGQASIQSALSIYCKKLVGDALLACQKKKYEDWGIPFPGADAATISITTPSDNGACANAKTTSLPAEVEASAIGVECDRTKKLCMFQNVVCDEDVNKKVIIICPVSTDRPCTASQIQSCADWMPEAGVSKAKIQDESTMTE